ncbi:MAG TPA: hypothetical protein VF622_03340 [Segetibacter sp.]|jgi:hypothetical protein
MRHSFLFIFISFCIGASAQEVLFIGTYSKRMPGKSYWCSDMQLETKKVLSKKEYFDVADKFKEEHKDQSPSTRSVESGYVIIYSFQKENAAFNCIEKITSYKIGTDEADAKRKLEEEMLKEPKKFKTKPEVIYKWAATSANDNSKLEPDIIEGVRVALTPIKNSSGQITATRGEFVNTNKEQAISMLLVVDGVPEKTPYVLQHGEKLNIKLPVAKTIDLKIEKAQKGASPGIINWIKAKVKAKVREVNGELKINNGASLGGRG